MQDKAVTKSALAAELECAPSSITNLVQHGLPVRQDGKLNRHQVLSWIIQTCSGVGGGWEGGIRGKASIRERAVRLLGKAQLNGGGRTKQRAKAADPETEAVKRAGAFEGGKTVGVITACRWLCGNVRSSLPELLSTFKLPEQPLSARGASNLTIAFVFTYVDFLMRGWSEEPFKYAREIGLDVSLPEVDWSAWGKDAAGMKQLYELELRVLGGETFEGPEGKQLVRIPGEEDSAASDRDDQ